MKKMIFGAALLGSLFLGSTVNAQAVSGRISTPGFSLRVGVNDRPVYGHSGYGRGSRMIAMQQDKIRDMKRMAWEDGYLSWRERRMIAFEEDRLNEMIANRGYNRNRW